MASELSLLHVSQTKRAGFVILAQRFYFYLHEYGVRKTRPALEKIFPSFWGAATAAAAGGYFY